MQKPQNISLNALRVFLTAAQRNSIKDAAADLNVTSGAVSHQVRALEDALGVRLFSRRNNAIELTVAGSRLMHLSQPALNTLHEALNDVVRDANELRVSASMTFASRWLIPKLSDFKQRNPQSRVRLESYFGIGAELGAEADVTIAYYKAGNVPNGATILFEDICRPYASPALADLYVDPSDLRKIPALQCAQGNWDWNLWLAETGHAEVLLNFAEYFDLDDAALRAAASGMGMVLTSQFMVQDEIDAGRLISLPYYPKATLGAYVVHQPDLETKLSNRFVHWLQRMSTL